MGIPNSGEALKSDINVPYPDILQNSNGTDSDKRAKESYTNMNGY